LFIRQQNAVINAIRAHLAEFGIVAPVGRNGVETLLNIVADTSDRRIPAIARGCLAATRHSATSIEGPDPEFRPPDHGLAPIP
jgi:transposase